MAQVKEAFALQVTPDLMLKLTKENYPSKEVPRKPKRPTPRAGEGRQKSDSKTDLRPTPAISSQDVPKPYYPGFLSSLPGFHENTDPQKDLVPIYKIMEETEKMNEKLQRREEQELEKVRQLAQELQDKQFRAPSQPIPCQVEKETCLQCYRNNTKTPLECAVAVRVFRECSQRVHQNFAQRTAAASQ